MAGVGVTIYGSVKDTLLDLGFFEEVAEDEYFVSVTFRNSTGMCSSTKLTNLPLGDRAVINAGGLGYHLPLLEKQAVVGNWTKGACFSTMGYHYFYDLATAPLYVPANKSPNTVSFFLCISFLDNPGRLTIFFL